MFTHIIWDFDGTLFDTYPAMACIFKQTLQSKGIEESQEKIMNKMKISMSYALDHYQKKHAIRSPFTKEYKEQQENESAKFVKPFEGIMELCAYIHQTGRHNYLYTHRGHSAISLLEKFGMKEYFSDFITLDQGFARKPSPDAIHHLLTTHDMIPNQAIMIGDRELDILAAKHAGISACFFTEGKVENSQEADFNIQTFQELYSIIDHT